MAHFKHWLAPGALAALTVVFVLLGRWQLERAAWHRQQEEAFQTTTGIAPLTRVPAADEAGALRFRPIRLHGSYEPARQILLDNMTRDGRVGYEVLTPFRADSGALVLVNRGWLPASPDRRELPDVGIAAQDRGRRSISGRIDGLPRAALALGGSAPAGAEPVVVLSYPEFAAIDAVLDEAPARFQLRLDGAEPFGFERAFAPPAGRAERSIAYAVQWFALAALAAGLAAGVVLRSRSRSRSRSE